MSSNLSLRDQKILLGFVVLIALLVGVVAWASSRRHDFSGPGALAVDRDDRVWIAADDSLLITDAEGALLHNVPLVTLGIRMPVASLAVRPDGRLLVGSREDGTLHVVTLSEPMSAQRLTAGRQERKPYSTFHLGIDSTTGQVLMSDVAHHRVLRLDETGLVLEQVATPEFRPGEFHFPNGVAVDRRGYAYVADTNHHRVALVGKNLEVIGSFSTAPIGFGWPVFVGLADDGTLYLTLHGDQLEFGTLQHVSPTGVLLETLDLPTPMRLNGIAVRSQDVVVSDQESFAVYRIDRRDRTVHPFGDAAVLAKFEQDRASRDNYRALSEGARLAVIGAGIAVLVVLLLARRRTAVPGRAGTNPAPLRSPVPLSVSFEASLLTLPILLGVFQALLFGISLVMTAIFFGPAEAAAASLVQLFFVVSWLCVAWLFRWAYIRRLLKGRYSDIFRWKARRLSQRLHKVMAHTLVPGERIEDFICVDTRHAPALLVVTDARLLLITHTLVGAHVLRIQSLPRGAISGAAVTRAHPWTEWLHYLGLPVWQLMLAAGGRREIYRLFVPDGAAAHRLVIGLKASTRPGDTREFNDIPYPEQVQPGRSLPTAMLLSALSPGLGQLYHHDLYRGLVMLCVFWIFAVSNLRLFLGHVLRLEEVPPTQLLMAASTLAVVWLFSLFETWRMTRRSIRNEIGLLATPKPPKH